MLFPWSNELLLEINLSHAAPQTKFGQTCHRFKHLGIPPQTPVDSYFFKHICPNQNNKTKFTHVWNLSCQEILISCFMLNLWWVDWHTVCRIVLSFPSFSLWTFVWWQKVKEISLFAPEKWHNAGENLPTWNFKRIFTEIQMAAEKKCKNEDEPLQLKELDPSCDDRWHTRYECNAVW